MTRRAKERQERREQSRSKVTPTTGGKKRKPLGPLFHSGDPTLAKRLEEEVYRSER